MDDGAESHPFMTVREIATLMRVSRATVYRLLHTGRLSGMRVGKVMRVPRQAVRDFMRDASIEQSSAASIRRCPPPESS